MDKVYRVQVTAINTESGEEEQVLDDKYAGFLLCADCGDGRMAEVIVHDTLFEMATRLAQGEKTKQAVRLANAMIGMKDDKIESAEARLLRAIMGDE